MLLPHWLHLAHRLLVSEPWQATRDNIKCEAHSQDVTKQGLGENQERAEWTLHILNYQLL